MPKLQKYNKKDGNVKTLETRQKKFESKKEKNKTHKDEIDLIAKKRFGQNFLTNIGVKSKIKQTLIDFLSEFEINNLLEIGPGKGDITDFLLTFDKNFRAIEIDPDAIIFLQNKFNLDKYSINVAENLLGNITQNTEEIEQENINSKNKIVQDLAEFLQTQKETNIELETNLQTENPENWKNVEIIEQNSDQKCYLDEKNTQELQNKLLENNEKKFQKDNSDLEDTNLGKNLRKDWLQFGDALQLVFQKKLPFEKFVLFSSLPYNVASRILVEMAINYSDCPFCVIVQKEIAMKLIDDRLTFFGAFLRLFYDFERAFDIHGGSFDPKPKVMSSLLIGRPKKQNLEQNLDNKSNEKKLNFKFKLEKIEESKEKSGKKLQEIEVLEKQNEEENKQIHKFQNAEILKQTQNLDSFLTKSENRQVICNILKKLVANPRKTLANNLVNLGWEKSKIEKFINKYNYQKTRLLYSNYQEILVRILEM